MYCTIAVAGTQLGGLKRCSMARRFAPAACRARFVVLGFFEMYRNKLGLVLR